jgi:hypothetical protein
MKNNYLSLVTNDNYIYCLNYEIISKLCKYYEYYTHNINWYLDGKCHYYNGSLLIYMIALLVFLLHFNRFTHSTVPIPVSVSIHQVNFASCRYMLLEMDRNIYLFIQHTEHLWNKIMWTISTKTCVFHPV